MTEGLRIAFKSVLLSAALMILTAFCTPARAQQSEIPDTIDEDFVIASLLISAPGEALYSRLGHAALHMQCPQHNLDYVFSYEGNEAASRVLSFFSGKLKMGMFAISPELYFKACEKEGREVKEYTLNLPIEAKRNLWRALDNRLLEGIDLPYDYLHRGCAYSTLKVLEEGLSPMELEFGPWPDEYELSRREIGHKALSSSKWVRCFLHLISGGEIDRQCINEDKVITPVQLLDVLSAASINGSPVISSEPETVVEGTSVIKSGWFSPLLLSIVLLMATILCAVVRASFMDYVLLSIQSVLGVITVYLVFFSSLVCTEWSWLIIPFNPLPLIFWKWRSHWALPFAIIILIWSGFMLFWPHLLTDSAFIVTSLCLSISYIAYYYRSKSYEKE